MKWTWRAGLATLAGTLVVAGGVAAKGPKSGLVAQLRGLQEVPVVSTVATGQFTATINSGETSFTYHLTYNGLQGTATQAHIHVGQRDVNGGIVIWLCQSAANPAPAGIPAVPTCTNGIGDFAGTVTSANVVATPAPPNGGQQIFAGDFAKVLAAIRAGKAYANVHSTLSPGGEIRGQIKVNGKNNNDDQDQDED
jgi:hypothetical protein